MTLARAHNRDTVPLRHYTSPNKGGAARATFTSHVKVSHFQCKGDIFVLISYYWSSRESNCNPSLYASAVTGPGCLNVG